MRIDAHTHIFPPEVVEERARFIRLDSYFASIYTSPRARLATAAELIAELDTSGFDAAIALGWGWGDGALCQMHNDYLIDVARTHTGRIFPFAALQPRDGDGAAHEAERALDAGLHGIGELMPHGQGYRLNHEVMRPLAEVAIARHAPLVIHVSEPVGHLYPGKGDVAPVEALALAQAFPGLRLVFAHWGGGLPFHELMPEVREALRSTLYDSAASPYLYEPAVYDVATRVVGRDRVLFGSDWPLLPMARCAAEVPAGWDDVLGGNAGRLLGT